MLESPPGLEIIPVLRSCQWKTKTYPYSFDGGSVFYQISEVSIIKYNTSYMAIPVVPHKAVAEVSKIGNL